MVVPLLVGLAFSVTHISDTGISTDKIYVDKIEVSDYIKVRGETLAKTCDIVVARDLNQAADIYCLDNDCSDEIQAAIDTVAAKGGGTVCIRAGEYPIGNEILVSNNIVLTGDGDSTILKLKDGVNKPVIHNINHSLNSFDANFNITIENLVIDGNKEGQTLSPSSCIRLVGVTNAIIKNVKLYNCHDQALDLAYDKNMFISNIFIDTVGRNGIFIGYSSRNIVLNNFIIKNVVGDVAGGYGIMIGDYRPNNIVILNGIINNTKLHGIGMTADKVLINNVIISNTGSNSLRIACSNEIIVSNIKIYNSSAAGIRIFCDLYNVSKITISNFQLDNIAIHGIIISNLGTGYELSNITISNGFIDANEHGIVIIGAKNVNINNVIAISEGAVAGKYALYLDNVKDSIISSNYFLSKNGAGIRVEDTSNVVFSGNIISSLTTVSIYELGTSTNNIYVNNILKGSGYSVTGSSYYDDYKYTTLPTCTTDSVFNGRTITYYNGTAYFRCTCIDNAWRCVQIS